MSKLRIVLTSLVLIGFLADSGSSQLKPCCSGDDNCGENAGQTSCCQSKSLTGCQCGPGTWKDCGAMFPVCKKRKGYCKGLFECETLGTLGVIGLALVLCSGGTVLLMKR